MPPSDLDRKVDEILSLMKAQHPATENSPAAGQLVQEFWRYGYGGTSGEDGRRKRELLLQSLEIYKRDYCIGPMENLAEGPSALEALNAILGEELKAATQSRDGCLEINMALEVAPHDKAVDDHVSGVVRTMERILTNLLMRCQAEGALPADRDPRAVARHLLALIVSIRVFARMSNKSMLRSTFEYCRLLVGATVRRTKRGV